MGAYLADNKIEIGNIYKAKEFPSRHLLVLKCIDGKRIGGFNNLFSVLCLEEGVQRTYYEKTIQSNYEPV